MKFKTRPSSGIVTITIDTPRGERTLSTGTTDLKEAKELAKAANIETIEVLSKAGQLTQELIQKLTIAGSMSVSEAIDKWEAWLRDTAGSDRTADNHVMYARAWAVDMKVANQKLCNVTEGMISRWINDDSSNKWSTRKVKLAALRSLFKFCSIRQYLNPDPAREVRIKAKLLSHEQKETRKKKIFTDEEITKIVDHLTGKIVELAGMTQTESVQRRLNTARFWISATLIGRYSGLRLGDICCLEWSCMAEKGKFTVWTDKKNTRVSMPVGDKLAKGLSSIPTNNRKHCFPEQDAISRDSKKRAILSVQFSRILEECEIEGHSFHDLRHTLATELKVNGNSIEDIAIALGHTSTESTEGYIH